MGKLDGRVALVTGAARGQGAAEARLFAEEGALVVVADVLDDLGSEVVHELGEGAGFVHLDVADPAGWSAAVEWCESHCGPIGILVNNAAIFRPGGVEDTTPEAYAQVIAVNQVGCFLGMRAVVPSMRRAGGGAIVNVSSTGGLVGIPGNIAYNSSKWAVRGLTKAAALELAPSIRVNSLHPGPVDTPMIHEEGLSDEDFRRRWASLVPLERAASPGEIARAALFLASDDSSFVTGTELVVDGGRTAGSAPPAPQSR